MQAKDAQKHVIEQGGGQQRKHQRDAQCSNHRDRQRPQHVGACADAVGQRQQAEQGCQRRHQHRTQTPAAGLDERLDERQPAVTQMIHVVEHQDAVLGDNADADDRTQKRHDVQGGVRQPQGAHHADQCQHGAADDGQRMQHRTELQQQNAIDQ